MWRRLSQLHPSSHMESLPQSLCEEETSVMPKFYFVISILVGKLEEKQLVA